jgi:signal transduction histidine kinase
MTISGTFTTVEPDFAQLRRLTEISRALTYTTSLDQVQRLTVERGADLLDASAAVLMLADADGLLHVLATHGVAAERVLRFQSPLDDEVIGRLQGLLDVPDDCFVAVPLIVGGAVTGLLAVATRRTSTGVDESLLSALADQAAVALENARLGDEVRQQMEARQASEGATTAKDRALSTLAHDIRTPIGAIDAYSALLQDELYGPVNDRQREALGRVRMSGRHLLSLLDNVMEMARLNAGVLRVESEPVNLTDVAREAVHMLLPQADARLQTLQLGRPANVLVNGRPRPRPPGPREPDRQRRQVHARGRLGHRRHRHPKRRRRSLGGDPRHRHGAGHRGRRHGGHLRAVLPQRGDRPTSGRRPRPGHLARPDAPDGREPGGGKQARRRILVHPPVPAPGDGVTLPRA